MALNFDRSDQAAVLNRLAKRRNVFTVLFVICLALGSVAGLVPVIGWYLSVALFVLWGVFAGCRIIPD